MEVFAILLSGPAAFVASIAYGLLLTKFVAHIEPLRRLMWAVSVCVLLLLGVEVALLSNVGAIGSRTLIGPAFYPLHTVIFVLGTPALVNLVALWRPGGLRRWYWVVPFCVIVAMGLTVMQYVVSESLHGMDGTNGPFSSTPQNH